MSQSHKKAPNLSARQISPIDSLLMQVDTGVRTIFGGVTHTSRINPAERAKCQDNAGTRTATPPPLSQGDKDLAGRLMRINHAGEVAAQGLYQGQALTAKLPHVREQMEQAAMEENDHLDWCRKRSNQLGTHTSLLDPLWYTGSVAIGAAAGLAGDKWSLGFVAETERQVVKHLDDHLNQLPEHDIESRAILEQMKIDEGQHATAATSAGGAELPTPVQKIMGLMSKVMTKTAYWV